MAQSLRCIFGTFEIKVGGASRQWLQGAYILYAVRSGHDVCRALGARRGRGIQNVQTYCGHSSHCSGSPEPTYRAPAEIPPRQLDLARRTLRAQRTACGPSFARRFTICTNRSSASLRRTNFRGSKRAQSHAPRLVAAALCRAVGGEIVSELLIQRQKRAGRIASEKEDAGFDTVLQSAARTSVHG
jgi:hypothetical protein